MPRPMGTKRFSNPQALSSALAVLGTLQSRAFGLLNCLVPLVLAFNYYICYSFSNNFFANNVFCNVILTHGIGQLINRYLFV